MPCGPLGCWSFAIIQSVHVNFINCLKFPFEIKHHDIYKSCIFEFIGRLKKCCQCGFFQTIHGKSTGKNKQCFNHSKYNPTQFVLKFLND